MKRKRVLILIAKLLLAVGLIYYLLASGKIDLSRLTAVSNWGWIAVAQVLVFFLLFFTAFRWHLLLAAQGIHYRVGEIFALGMIGFFFNQFVPGSTGGDLMKAYYIAVEQPRYRAAGVTTVFLDRVIGLIVLIAISGVAILANLPLIRSDPHLRILALVVVVILVSAVVAGLLFYSDRVRSHPVVQAISRRVPFHSVLHKVQAAVYVYKHQPRVIIVAVLLSVLVQVSVILSILCFSFALSGGDAAGGAVSLWSFFFLVPLAQLAMAVPISPPGGLGVGEWAYTELFEKAGYGDGGILALYQRISWYAWALIGLVLYLRKKKRVDRAIAMGDRLEESGGPDTREERDGSRDERGIERSEARAATVDRPQGAHERAIREP